MAQNIYFNPFLAPSEALGFILVYYIPSNSSSGHFYKLFRFGAILPIAGGSKISNKTSPCVMKVRKVMKVMSKSAFLYILYFMF